MRRRYTKQTASVTHSDTEVAKVPDHLAKALTRGNRPCFGLLALAS